MAQIEERLKQMGIELPGPREPAGNYISAVRTGNLVFLAGVLSVTPDGTRIVGKLGKELTVEQGYEAARWCGVRILANLRREIGDLDKVVKFVKLSGMVNSMPDFTRNAAVVNGCSDLLVELYGERGRHARCAVGMVTLPGGMAVEVESVVEVEP